MANPALIALGAELLKTVVSKTFNKEAIKENAKQTSTKVAGVLATVAAAPSVAEMAQTGAVIPQSEGEIIFQLITALGALIMYYVDQRAK